VSAVRDSPYINHPIALAKLLACEALERDGRLLAAHRAQRTRSVSLSRVFSCPYQPLATSARS
jgi:hypothetical protein